MLLEGTLNLLKWLQAGNYINTFLVGLLVFVVLRWHKRPHPRFPPGPRGIPFLGLIPFFSSKVHEDLARWSKGYGSVMSGRILNTDTVYLTTYEAVHEAFVKLGPKISDRGEMKILEDVNLGFGLLEKPYNATCKAQRKFGSSIFRGFGDSKINMDDITQLEAEKLVCHLRSNSGKIINIKPDFYNATANVMAQVTLGQRFEYDDVEFRNILNCCAHSAENPESTSALMGVMLLHQLRFVPPFRAAYKEYIELHQQIKKFLKLKIDEHKQNFDPDNVKDFIDAFLKEQKMGKTEDRKHFSDDELLGFIKDLFLAGIETSSNTLAWACLTLLHHPECQHFIQTEIDQVIGKEEQPKLSHKADMPYTSAFIQELMRFHTLVPISVPHSTAVDVEVCGYHIPKQTRIHALHWAIHNDPKTWPKPDKFDPLRHIDENGKFVRSERIIPFSIGLRRCLGEKLANVEVFMFLVAILKSFNIRPDPEAPQLPRMDEGALGLVYAPLSFTCLLESRVL